MSPRSRPCTNWSGCCMYGFGEIEPKVWVPSLKMALSFVPLATRKQKWRRRFQAFQRGFIRRNRPRDDEARLKSLEEKPSVPAGRASVPAGRASVPAGGASVPAGGVNCSLYAAMELSSSFSVLGNLLRLVRNESSCSPWSFSAPSSEDLAWISNQVDPTRIFMIFHADQTYSWESRWCSGTQHFWAEVRSPLIKINTFFLKKKDKTSEPKFQSLFICLFVYWYVLKLLPSSTRLMWRCSLEERTDKERRKRGYRSKEKRRKKKQKKTERKKKERKKRRSGQTKRELVRREMTTQSTCKATFRRTRDNRGWQRVEQRSSRWEKRLQAAEVRHEKMYSAKTEATWDNLLQSPDAF